MKISSTTPTLAALIWVLVTSCSDATSSNEPVSLQHEGSVASIGADESAYVRLAPKEVRKRGNHLVGAGSAYLLQHAYNPLDWYPWSEEALRRAKDEDKPIFLSIGYSSCHWCHVMEREVFEHDDVAAFMNQHFVSIKVDREERPDLDAVYMDAVHFMTGRGGWPMSVFLTPDLKPFAGGTYFPHDHFLKLVTDIHEKYETERQTIEGLADRIFKRVSAEPETAAGSSVDSVLVENAARQALGRFDETWGGIRSGQKFPTPLRWHFLLHHYRKTGDQGYGRMVQVTLDRMGSGGIHDHVGGGFHRYTVEQTWLIPHFEKMLYDNAQIAALYTEASTVFGNVGYAEIARHTLDFIIRDMSGEEGAFYSSYDADSGGEEGSFYIWSPQEITRVAGATDGPPLSMLLGVTEQGNFQGKSVLTRRVTPAEVASRFGRDQAEVALLVQKYRDALRRFRAQRIGPDLDRKIITSWNGLAIAALAQGYVAFRDEEYLQAAERAGEYLWNTHRSSDGGLFRSSNQRMPANEGVLDDYAFLALGFLELFQASADPKQLTRGLTLIEYARDHFKHPRGGFYFSAQGQHAPLGRHVQIHDSVRPSGNSAMLQALIRAAALTGNGGYREDVETTLGAYAEEMRTAGLDMAWWFDAAEKHSGPYYEVVIAGDPSDARTAQLRATFRRLNPSHAVLIMLPGRGGDAGLIRLMPSIKGKRALSGRATAYVCQFGTCKLPTSDPAQMGRQILSGWTR